MVYPDQQRSTPLAFGRSVDESGVDECTVLTFLLPLPVQGVHLFLVFAPSSDVFHDEGTK